MFGNAIARYTHAAKQTLGMEPSHPVMVDIYERSGDGSWVRKTDWGQRRKTDDGEEKYHLLKADRETPPVPYKYQGTTGDGRTHVSFIRAGDELFQPIRPNFTTDADGRVGDVFEGFDHNMLEWFTQEVKREHAFWEEDDGSFWTSPQGAALVVFFGGAVFFLFLGFAFEKSMGAIAADMSQSASQMAQAAQQLAGAGG